MNVLAEKINLETLPRHIAIIMDGNGRWAVERGKQRLYGHLNAIDSVRTVTEAAAKIGVKYLTLYAFSTENWDRPKDEVQGLMALLVKTIHGEVPTLNKNNIRLQMIGDFDMLPKDAQDEWAVALDQTSSNTGLILVVALSYSGRWDIQNAVKKIAADVEANKLTPSDINDDLIADYLSTKDFPDPELMIRTSGEYRISNFLLYQLAYSELYFTDTLWPDFGADDLYKAIIDYQSRERRFGKTSDQVSPNGKNEKV